ncbi:MAG: hypothetical protein WCE90_03060 [Candidatus Zixiibacteriota bacterium]
MSKEIKGKRIMQSLFLQEEEYISKNFDLNHESGSKLLIRLMEKTKEFIKSSGFKSGQYPECSIILHALHTLMALNNSLVLLSKGYMGDCEAVHKRAVEFVLRAIYFREFPQEERKWREKTGKLLDRKSIASILDEKHEQKAIFPTDSETFWGDFVYDSIYKSINEWAHGDFQAMYYEVAIDNGTEYYTHKFVIGPKPDERFVKTMIRRLIHTCRIQVLFLAQTLSYPPEKYHDLMIESEKYLTNN